MRMMDVLHAIPRTVLWALALCVSLGAIVALALTVPADPRSPSPDGRIFVLLEGPNPGIRSLDPSGRQVIDVLALSSGPVRVGFDASSDGSLVAYSEADLDDVDPRSRIGIVATDDPEVTTPLETTVRDRFLIHPSFSPTAARLIFTDSTFGRSGEEHTLSRMRADGEDLRRLASSRDPQCWFASWSPDGQRIACIDQTQRRQRLIITDRRARAFDVIFRPERRMGLTNVAWSPDGATLVFSMFDGLDRFAVDDLWSISATGSDLTRLTDSPRIGESDAAFSPDGTRLAVLRREGEDTGRLLLMDVGGTNPTLLDEAGQGVASVAWVRPADS